jgi:hypothetical protein
MHGHPATHATSATPSPAKWPLAIDSKFEKYQLPVGMAGFEPAASCSQSRRANQAALHPGARDPAQAARAALRKCTGKPG